MLPEYKLVYLKLKFPYRVTKIQKYTHTHIHIPGIHYSTICNETKDGQNCLLIWAWLNKLQHIHTMEHVAAKRHKECLYILVLSYLEETIGTAKRKEN